MIILVELEVWFNLSTMAARKGIPVVVVNGRLTERSHRRLACLGGAVRRMFASLRWVGAQDEQIADRFRSLGTPADHVEITASLKWDTAQVADKVDGADALAHAVGIDPARPVWVCGSTGDAEEGLLLTAYEALAQSRVRPIPQLVIVPRKPERFDEVASLIERRGYECRRRSRMADGAHHIVAGRKAVILGDTMGELRKFYSLAHVVFVGRSLVAMGGSDPMEVAGLGRPMVVGPHMENFALPVAALEQGGGLMRVADAQQLAQAVGHLAGNEDLRTRMGAAAREVVRQNQGATARTADRLAALLAGSAVDISRRSYESERASRDLERRSQS